MQLVAVAGHLQQRLVRIDDLLEVHAAFRDVREGGRCVVAGVELPHVGLLQRAPRIDAGENAPREVAAHRHEVDSGVERRFDPPQVAADLQQVLVREGLVNREVRRAPTEVGRGRGFHPGARRSRHGRHVHLVAQQPRGGQRQQCQLDGCGEASRVGDAPRRADAVAVQLRKSVDEAVALVAEVLCEVDDLHAGGNVVRFEPFAALAVRRTEQQHVDRREVEAVAETHVRVAFQPSVDLREAVARVRGAVHEDDFGLRVIDQKADEFAGGVAGASDDAGAYHFPLRFWTLW